MIAPPNQETPDETQRSRLGYHLLGPLMIGIVTALLKAASARKISRLMFVARDAHLLLRVAEILRPTSRLTADMQFEYLMLSRRLLALPTLTTLNATAVRQALRVGGDATEPLIRFCHYYGLSVTQLRACIGLPARGLDDSSVHSPVGAGATPLIDVISQGKVRDFIAQEQIRQRQQVIAYLDQQSLFNSECKALVDVGWRGSIQSWLYALQPKVSAAENLVGLYIGLWSDDPDWAVPVGENFVAVVSDIRHGKNLRNGAAWYASSLVEALTRADHGTVIGLDHTDTGSVEPVLSEATPSRRAEIESDQYRAAIIEGIIQFAKDFAAHHAPVEAKAPQPMSIAQIRDELLRLAFVPTQDEIRILGRLIVTEGNAPEWSSPLIAAQLPSPWRTPKQWLSGLRSPWRGGYVMASAGKLLSVAHRLIEALLMRLPVELKEKMRLLVKRIIRNSSQN